MQQYIIMCRSLTYAQKAGRVLERAGIYSSITKAPQGVTPEGCTYGLKVRETHFREALSLVRAAGIRTGKLYVLRPDGSAGEVTA